MIDNFLTSMDTTKFEDKLKIYADNELMGNAFIEGMNSKISFSETQLKKVSDSIKFKRELFNDIERILDLYVIPYAGFFPLPQYDFKFRKRIRMEFEIAYQASLKGSTKSLETNISIYDRIVAYLIDNFGWIFPNRQSMTAPQMEKMYETMIKEVQ